MLFIFLLPIALALADEFGGFTVKSELTTYSNTLLYNTVYGLGTEDASSNYSPSSESFSMYSTSVYSTSSERRVSQTPVSLSSSPSNNRATASTPSPTVSSFVISSTPATSSSTSTSIPVKSPAGTPASIVTTAVPSQQCQDRGQVVTTKLTETTVKIVSVTRQMTSTARIYANTSTSSSSFRPAASTHLNSSPLSSSPPSPSPPSPPFPSPSPPPSYSSVLRTVSMQSSTPFSCQATATQTVYVVRNVGRAAEDSGYTDQPKPSRISRSAVPLPDIISPSGTFKWSCNLLEPQSNVSDAVNSDIELSRHPKLQCLLDFQGAEGPVAENLTVSLGSPIDVDVEVEFQTSNAAVTSIASGFKASDAFPYTTSEYAYGTASFRSASSVHPQSPRSIDSILSSSAYNSTAYPSLKPFSSTVTANVSTNASTATPVLPSLQTSGSTTRNLVTLTPQLSLPTFPTSTAQSTSQPSRSGLARESHAYACGEVNNNSDLLLCGRNRGNQLKISFNSQVVAYSVIMLLYL